MPNRTEARPAKAVLTYATGRLPLLRLFSTPLIIRTDQCELESSQNMNEIARLRQLSGVTMNVPSMLGGQVQAVHKNRAQHGIAFMPVLRRTNPLSRKQSERFCGILPGLWVECCWCGPVFAEFRA